MDDLCDNSWSFSFNYWGSLQARQYPQFTRQYEFVMRDREPNMTWKFTESNNVQVESYPELVPSRTEDWGWQMRNKFVLLETFDKEKGDPNRNLKRKEQPKAISLTDTDGQDAIIEFVGEEDGEGRFIIFHYNL